MRYMKIQITAWRDRATLRLTATQRQFAALDERELSIRQILADSETPQADAVDQQATNPELAQVSADRTALHDGEESLAKAAIAASLMHSRVGSFGYQEINDEGTEMVSIRDEAGNLFPATALYEYEIVDRDPPMPKWGTPPPPPPEQDQSAKDDSPDA